METAGTLLRLAAEVVEDSLPKRLSSFRQRLTPLSAVIKCKTLKVAKTTWTVEQVTAGIFENSQFNFLPNN